MREEGSLESLFIHSLGKQIFIELLVCVKDYIKCLIYTSNKTRRSLPSWGLRSSEEYTEYIERNE